MSSEAGVLPASRPWPLAWQRITAVPVAWWVTAMVAVAVVLRLPAMGMGIWTDETLTAHALQATDPLSVIGRVVDQEHNPPAYYLAIWPWSLASGTGELALKAPSFLFGVLLVPATYWLGGLTVRREAAVIAALMATFSGVAVYQSQEARAYTLVALLTCLTVGTYLMATRSPRPWRWAAGLAVAGSALVYTQYTGALVMVGLVLALGVSMLVGHRPARLLPVAIGFAAVALAFVPWIPVFVMHLRTSDSYETTVPIAERPLLFVDDLGYGLPLPSSVLRSGLARSMVVLAGGLLFVAMVRPSYRRTLASRLATVSVGTVTLAVVVGVVALAEAAQSLGERHMFLVSPLVWVLAGGAAVWGIDALRRLGRPRVRAFVLLTTAALIAAWFALGIGYAALLGTTPKSGVRTLVGEEPQVTAAGTQVVLAPDYLASAYEYYAPDGPAAHGLARWDQSSGSGPVEWHDDWLAADASRTLDLIAGGADAFPCLAFVYEPGPYGVGLPYERSADLLAGLLARYPLIHQREFPGRNEHPTLYLFALREGGCETAGAAAAAVGAVR